VAPIIRYADIVAIALILVAQRLARAIWRLFLLDGC
jgi:hypothetical protein